MSRSLRLQLALLCSVSAIAICPADKASAGQLPASAFQSYDPTTASSVQAGPFALFTVPVNTIHPTQLNLGFAEVAKKTSAYNLLTPSGLANDLLTGGSIEPVVIGPGGVLYLTNGHHTFTSLTQSIYGASNPSVYVNVIANYSNLTQTQFEAQLQASNFLLPLDNGVVKAVDPVTGAPIPSTFAGMTNDPYRGLEYSVLKNKSSVLFPSAANITGAIGATKPGLDKTAAFYSDFILANAYRGANGGLGLPYLSPGDIAIATKWNLTGSNVTTLQQGGSAITAAQIPGYILPSAAGSIAIGSAITDATLANGVLDGNGTFNGLRNLNLGSVTIGSTAPGFIMQLGNDLGGTVTLTGANTYSGGTTILAGTLIVNGDAALGAAAPTNVTIDPNNILASVQAANGITFNSLSEGAGRIQFSSSFTLNRPIAVSGEIATLNPNGNTLTLAGPIVSVGPGANGLGSANGESDLTINGTGKVILAPTSGSNSLFYGNWIVSGGTLTASSDAALGNTTGAAYTIGQIVLDGGTFQSGASFNSVRNLTLTGSSTFDTNGFTTSFAGAVTDVQRTLTLMNSSTSTAGAVTFGSLNISGTNTTTATGATATLALNGGTRGVTTTLTNGVTRTDRSALVITPSTTTSLGTTEKVTSGTAPTLTNGIVAPWTIINTAAAANNNLDFATYGANGYVAAAYTTHTIAGNTVVATDVVKQNGNVALTANVNAYALNVQRNTNITGASTLTLGDGTNPAGLILNGTASNTTSIGVSTLAFGASEAVIFAMGSQTSTTNSNVISSQITGTGGLTVAGATNGLVALTNNTSTLSGPINIDSGTLRLAATNIFASNLSGVTLGNVKATPAILDLTASNSFKTLNSAGNNGTVSFSNGATLTIGDTTNNLGSTLSSTITETGTAVTGALTKNGSGLLDLSGVGSAKLTLVTGSSVVVNGGQLRMSASAFANPNDIVLNNGSELQLTESGGSILANNVSGTGVVHLMGGTLRLAGANNSYSGGTVVEAGSSLSLTTANVSTGNGNITNAGGFVVFDQATSGVYSGVISNGGQLGIGPTLAGSLIKDDSTGASSGNVTLNAIQTFTGATFVEAGTLTLGVANALAASSKVDLGRVGGPLGTGAAASNGAVTATLALNADNTIQGLMSEAGNNTTVQLNASNLTLNVASGTAFNYGGTISGIGGLLKSGGGTETLAGANTYLGGTTISAGTMQLGNAAALGTGGLTFGAGSTGNLDLNGFSSTVATLNNSGSVGTITNSNAAATLTVSGGGAYGGVIQNSAGVTGLAVTGGTLILTGTSTYAGGTTISAGALQIGNGGTIGSITGNITNNATLAFNRSDAVTFGGVIAGAGVVNQSGAGLTILSGANSAAAGQFTGTANVNAGILAINGTFGDTANNTAVVTVNSSGTLHGSGTVAGSVVVNTGGTVSAGNSPGTLTVARDYTLNAGSTSLFELGTPGAVGGTDNDLINVGRNLTLGGTLNAVSSASGAASPVAGEYRLYTYGGTLTGAFSAVTTPTAQSATVFTNVPGQVNLLVANAGQFLQYWDGTDTTGATAGGQGGAGTWNAGNTNWTGSPTSQVNNSWRSGVGIFGGVAGAVTVAAAQSFQGLQFAVDGYRLAGAGTLNLIGDSFSTPTQSFINVNTGVGVTIANALTSTGGAFGLNKIGAGTLTLTGVSTYTGTTTVTNGTLAIAAGGSLAGAVVNNATFSNSGNVGALSNAATATNTGTIASLSNVGGTFGNSGSVTGASSVSGGVATNTGVFQSTLGLTAGTFINNTGGTVAGATTNAGGTLTNNGGAFAAVTNTSGTFANNAGNVGAVTNAATATNAGTIASLSNAGGVFANSGIVTGASSVSGGTATNTGVFQSTLGLTAGTFINNTGGMVAGATTNTGGTLTNNGGVFAAVTNTSGTFANNAGNVGAVTNAATATNAGTIASLSNTGGTFANSGSVTGASRVSGGVLTTTGTLAGGLANTATVNANGGAVNAAIANNAGSFNVGGTVTSNATFSNANGATLIVLNGGSYTVGGLLTNAGLVTVANGGTLTATAGGVTNTATGAITNNGTISDDLNNAGIVNNNGAYVANVAFNSGSITNSASGMWTGNVVSNVGSIINSGTWIGSVVSNTGTLSNNGTWTGSIANAGSFTNAAGATVSGTLTNTAGTAVNNGIVGAVIVNGGVLTGNGSAGTLTVNTGTLMPGNGVPGTSMTVNGNLALASGVQYVVQLNPVTSSFVNVTGTAALGGATVNATFANGAYVSTRYTILNAAGGVAGIFGGQVSTNLPAGFNANLAYDTTRAYIDLSLNYGLVQGLNRNQQNVANTLVSFFNRTGGIPLAFGALTPAGLTQISGELGTGTQQATFDAMNLFMGVMIDPFVADRGEAISEPRSSVGYADDALGYAAKRSTPDPMAAIYRKSPPLVAPLFEQRWRMWSAGFGGSQTTDGNAALGSGTATSRIYGGAVGLDYRLSPSTLAGIALAGGGTNFSVANAGTGRSDLFQAGAFVRHTVGATYLTAALAYGWQDVTTDRSVGADRLNARFTTDALSGRVEGGTRFVDSTLGIGITPYAAAQFTTVYLPDYRETSGVANTFGLNYAARDATASRSELGLRSDRSYAMQDGVFTLRGRAAWAHNFDPDRGISATFQSLPGASFIVNGAAQARDAALVTGSAEMKWRSGWALAATFEGEFSNVTRSYAGKGVVRYGW